MTHRHVLPTTTSPYDDFAMLKGIILLLFVAQALALHPMCGVDPNVQSYPALPEGATLKTVVIIARHGDRTRVHVDGCWDDDNNVWECPIGVYDTCQCHCRSSWRIR